MSLLTNVETAIEASLESMINTRAASIELDVFRLGGDISTLATKVGELMDGLKQHKEVIQSLAHQHHQLVSSVSTRGASKLQYPSLYKKIPVGRN